MTTNCFFLILTKLFLKMFDFIYKLIIQNKKKINFRIDKFVLNRSFFSRFQDYRCALNCIIIKNTVLGLLSKFVKMSSVRDCVLICRALNLKNLTFLHKLYDRHFERFHTQLHSLLYTHAFKICTQITLFLLFCTTNYTLDIHHIIEKIQ